MLNKHNFGKYIRIIRLILIAIWYQLMSMLQMIQKQRWDVIIHVLTA